MRNYIVDMKLPFNIPFTDRDDLDKLKDYCFSSLKNGSPETINFDTKLMKELGILEAHGYDQNYGVDLDPSWVSESARRFFHKMGYYISGAEYFYFQPNHTMDIHIDGAAYCRKAKFNWAYGGNHTFQFFEALETGNKDGVQSAGSAYSWGFTEDQVELKEQAPMGTPSLVCVGVPHRVINGPSPLELFNVTVWKNGLKREEEDLGGMDFEDALKDFSDYVLQTST